MSRWLLSLMLFLNVAQAQVAVSVNENKVYLDNGDIKVAVPTPKDTLSILDLNVFPPVVRAEIEVPTSVIGPPTSVAVTADGRTAFVTAATQIDPANPSQTTGFNLVSVVDLTSARVIGSVEAGNGASGISLSPKGDVAVVANRREGTLSVFSWDGKQLTKAATVKVGEATSEPSHVVFTPDGKYLLVSRFGDNRISVFGVNGTQLEATGRDMSSGVRPYGLSMHPSGRFAVVANVGLNLGLDVDTISIIDTRKAPFYVRKTIQVASTPEGIMISPDGQYVGVVSHNGTGKPTNSPFYNPRGVVTVFRVQGDDLVKISENPIGRWSQGLAFTRDSRYLLVQNTVEQEIQVFGLSGNWVSDTGVWLKVKGGPAAIRVAGGN